MVSLSPTVFKAVTGKPRLKGKGNRPSLFQLTMLCKFLLVFLIRASLRYSSHHIQFIHLKCTIKWLLVSEQNCVTFVKSISEHFYEINFRAFTPQINPELFSSSAPCLLLFKQDLKKCNIFYIFVKMYWNWKNVTSSLANILLKLV